MALAPQMGATPSAGDPGAGAAGNSVKMRVQLQQQRGRGNTVDHASVTLTDPRGGGVTAAQVVAALQDLHNHPAIPNREQRRAAVALTRAIAWIQSRPPDGVAAVVKKSFYFDPGNPSHSWRFDVENLRGHNLRR